MPGSDKRKGKKQIPSKSANLPSGSKNKAPIPSTSQNPGNQSMVRERWISFETLISIIKARINNIKVPRSFAENCKVKKALGDLKIPEQAIDQQMKHNLIYVGEEIYLRLDTTFLCFKNRLHFIQYHINHYFSDKNLPYDSKLLDLIHSNDGVCPFTELLTFDRMRMVGATVEDLLRVTCEKVEVHFDAEGNPTGFRLTYPFILDE